MGEGDGNHPPAENLPSTKRNYARIVNMRDALFNDTRVSLICATQKKKLVLLSRYVNMRDAIWKNGEKRCVAHQLHKRGSGRLYCNLQCMIQVTNKMTVGRNAIFRFPLIFLCNIRGPENPEKIEIFLEQDF